LIIYLHNRLHKSIAYNKILAVLAVIFPPRITVCHTTECPPYKKKNNIRFQKRIRRTLVAVDRRPGWFTVQR